MKGELGWGLGIFKLQLDGGTTGPLNLVKKAGTENQRTPEEVLKESASRHWDSWTKPAHRQVIPRQEVPPASTDKPNGVVDVWRANRQRRSQ